MSGALAFWLTLVVTHSAAFWLGLFVACCAVGTSMKLDPEWWRQRITRQATAQREGDQQKSVAAWREELGRHG